jgi:acetylornithine deacetylase/succinyl-diaminopimelate desuccinylase-like protein
MGNRSPLESPLTDLIREWVAEQDPDALCVPTTLAGFTDSRTFRDAFPECMAYGFFPHFFRTRYETDPLMHSADERIDVRDLEFATRFFRDLAVRLFDRA